MKFLRFGALLIAAIFIGLNVSPVAAQSKSNECLCAHHRDDLGRCGQRSKEFILKTKEIQNQCALDKKSPENKSAGNNKEGVRGLKFWQRPAVFDF